MPANSKRGRPRHGDLLTPGEWRVVDAVRHGLTNPQIAQRQGVSVDAVKYHVGNALAKLGLRSRAELRRWDGVRVDSALKRAPASGFSSLGPLVQVARNVVDLEAAKAWYETALGMRLLYAFPGMAFFEMGEARLYLQEGKANPDESILYFRVADIHGAFEALSKRGVKFTNAPHRIHRHDDGLEEWLSFFEDNERRPLALMCQVSPAAVARPGQGA